MSLRHALVVDDSRSARVALKKLLEEHELQVSLAISGEEALEFLADQSVDVVFMDHTMPGMDGLEAVTAIKSNPGTATIPVMMYTTREGEVYVGQARALGAVGVMPKNVQPHQLFEMLASLGLVKDRRVQPRPEQADADVVELIEEYTEQDEVLDRQAMGVSVENLVSRILEDQHLTLRSDILRSQRTFAKQVAKEIVLEQARAEERLNPVQVSGSRFGNVLSAVMIVLIAVLGFLSWQFKDQRDSAITQLQRSSQTHSATLDAEVGDLRNAVNLTEDSLTRVMTSAFEGMEWAVNRGNQIPFGELAFNASAANTVDELLTRLADTGFRGVVSLQSHLGRFCLDIDEQGGYALAPPDSPAASCDYLGHDQDYSSRVSDRLSVPFARIYRRFSDGPIRLELEALDGSEAVVLVPYPDNSATAGEWNQAAKLNNRIVIRLTSE
ncbi:MAG: CheY-like chemotaxis protein [Limisphaerales bacterium]|jgi:CheY-like chemotaxis protein